MNVVAKIPRGDGSMVNVVPVPSGSKVPCIKNYKLHLNNCSGKFASEYKCTTKWNCGQTECCLQDPEGMREYGQCGPCEFGGENGFLHGLGTKCVNQWQCGNQECCLSVPEGFLHGKFMWGRCGGCPVGK